MTTPYNHLSKNPSISADALIDEFDFLKCSWFDTSILCLNDWRISDNPNGSVTVGGLRSLCLNSHQFVDKVDSIGRTLYSFDGLFDFEREKEIFWVEALIRCLTSQNKLLNIFAECRITRILATIRKTLDDFARNHNLQGMLLVSMKILRTCEVGREQTTIAISRIRKRGHVGPYSILDQGTVQL